MATTVTPFQAWLRALPKKPVDGARIAHSQSGDFISVFLNDEPFYTERVDELLTIHRSFHTHELVGCKLKGLSILAKNFVNLVRVHQPHQRCTLYFLLMNAVGVRQVAGHYYDIGRRLGTIELPDEMLEAQTA